MSRRCLWFLLLCGVAAVGGCGSGEPEILPQPSPEESKAQNEAYQKEMMAKMKQMRRPVPKPPGS